MKKNDLPIVIHSKVITYLYDSLPLCVLLSNESAIKWFYNHFTNLCIVTATDVNGYNCHNIKYAENGMYIDYCTYKETMIFNPIEGESVCLSQDIIEFVKTNIDDKNYLIAFSDWSVLPQSAQYEGEHFAHEMLIYGYDDDLQIIKCITFDKNRKFTKVLIPYSDFRKAFEALYRHLSEFDADFWTYLKYIYLIKLTPNEYTFSLTEFKKSLQDFCNGTISNVKRINLGFVDRCTRKTGKVNDVEQEMDEFWNYHFGIDVYTILCNILDNNRIRYGYENLNFLEFHIIFEHTKIILERLEYIAREYKDIQEYMERRILEYRKAVEISEMLRLYVLKYNTQCRLGWINNTNAVKYIERIKTKLMNIKEIEYKVYTDIIGEFNRLKY